MPIIIGMLASAVALPPNLLIALVFCRSVVRVHCSVYCLHCFYIFFNLNSQLPLSWLEVCLHNVIIFICYWRVLYIF